MFWRSLDLNINFFFDEKTCGLEAGELAAGPGWQPDEILSTRIEKKQFSTPSWAAGQPAPAPARQPAQLQPRPSVVQPSPGLAWPRLVSPGSLLRVQPGITSPQTLPGAKFPSDITRNQFPVPFWAKFPHGDSYLGGSLGPDWYWDTKYVSLYQIGPLAAHVVRVAMERILVF